MKATGITRPIDELGRIVIPKEMRKALELSPKDELEFYVEDGNIILKKVDASCIICGNKDNLQIIDEKNICADCIEKINKLNY